MRSIWRSLLTDGSQMTDERFFRIDPNGRGWVSNDLLRARLIAIYILAGVVALVGLAAWLVL